MEKLVANLSGPVRSGTLYGHSYLIAPATLLVPGVLNGSQGPLYYPPDEVGRNVTAWDGMPILVNHPQTPVSARTPEVLNAQGIGTILNARFSGSLKADLWFDAERTKAVDPSVYDALLNGQKIELSTGLSVENEATEGVHNTPEGPVAYRAIARNYRPDHLAILPNSVGACSLRDGCGVNNAEMSQDEVRTALDEAVRKRFGGTTEMTAVWVSDVYPDYLIYRTDDGLYRIGYSFQDGKAVLAEGEPKKVRQRTIYEEVSNVDGHVGSSYTSNVKGLASMDRKKVIDELIANSCCWAEEDRKELEAMTDNQLQRVKEAADKEAEMEMALNAAEKGFNDGRDEIHFNREKKAWEKTTKPEEKPVENTETPQTEVKGAALTAEQQRALNYGMEMMERERTELINRLVANVSEADRPKHRERLAKRDIDELREDARLLPPATANRYPGQPADRPVANQINREDRLEIPEMDWVANSVFAKK